MNTIKLSLFVVALCCTVGVNAQIFINTGNPNLDKYKSENPNAVIWENGKSVPIPPNTPIETKKEPTPKPVEVKKDPVTTVTEAKKDPVVSQTETKKDPVTTITEAKKDPVVNQTEVIQLH